MPLPTSADSLAPAPRGLDLPAIAARLRACIDALALDGVRLSRRIGVPYGTLRAYLAGLRAPSPECLAGLYVEFGLMPSWVLTGEGPQQRPPVSAPRLPDIVTVPLMSEASSWGSAPTAQESEPAYGASDAIPVRADWLAKHGWSGGDLAAVTVRGDALSPRLADGDLAWVDRRDVACHSGLVYAFEIEGEVLLRVCQRLPGGPVRLCGAHAGFPVLDLDAQLARDAVRGRVVGGLCRW